MNELFVDRTKLYFKHCHDEFIKCLEYPCTQGFFINTNKLDKESILKLIDFNYYSSPLTSNSYYHSHNNIGKTISYELGLIYPQEIASSISSNYVDTKDIKIVVDMCSSPGGKSINLMNKLKDNVLFICNEYNHKRCEILSSNLERLGLDNVVITNKHCDVIAKQLYNQADIVILDAPCSGEGMIRKYPDILDKYSIENIIGMSNIQSQLLENAYDILKDNGQLLYSTCTYAFEEDEDQIKKFLSKHPDIEIVDIDIKGNHSQLKGTIKICPLNNTEGQFICLMRKHKKDYANNKINYLKSIKNTTITKFINDNLCVGNYYLYENNNRYYLSFIELPDLKHNIFRYGIYLGEILKNRFVPSHNLYRSNLLKGSYKHVYELNDVEYLKYISGLEIKTDLSDSYYLLTYHNCSIGYGKCSNGIMKNKYPKGLRR